MTIRHNRGVHLAYALLNYAKRDIHKARMLENGLEGDEQIQEWMQYVEENISHLIKSDIEILFKDSIVNFMILLWITIENQYETVDELLNELDKLTVDEYLFYIYDCYLEIENKDEQNEKTILTVLSGEDKQLEAKAIVEFVKFPELTISRMNQSIRSFYTEYVKPYEKEIDIKIQEAVKKDENFLQENKEEFFQVISEGRYLYEDKEETKDLSLYASYFYDFGGITYFRVTEDNLPVIIYNAMHNEKYSDEQIKKRTVELFKTLADEKRIDILRLLSKRKWYSKELAEYFNLSTATMSYHMGKLFDMGLISMETGELNRLYYSLNKKKAKALFDNIVKNTFGSI